MSTAAQQTPSAHLVRVEALRDVLVLAENSDIELVPVCTWRLQAQDVQHGYKPSVAGQLASYQCDVAERRAMVAAWASAFEGNVVERPNEDFVACEAQFYMGDTLVYAWAHLHPDSQCPDCDGPAVGGQVLQHCADSPCTTAAAALAAGA